MENNLQTQKAGDGAQQFQANQIIINQGITEERARAIFTEMIEQSIAPYTQDAYDTAYRRIGRLENIVLPRLAGIDGALEHFADPAFQIVIRKAEQAAAATEREEDYEMLSELLLCHVQKGEDRINRAAIHRAIEIIDQIDNEALFALTVVVAATALVPSDSECSQGLKTDAGILSSLMYQHLPLQCEWMDHLEMLGAIKLVWGHPTGRLINFYKHKMNGYVCVGIRKNSRAYDKAVGLLKNTRLSPDSILRDNELLEGYVRIPTCSKQNLENMIVSNGEEQRHINKYEISVLNSILELYTRDSSLQCCVEKSFEDMMKQFPVFAEISNWWKSLPTALLPTTVGKIIAQTNARRFMQDFPDMI